MKRLLLSVAMLAVVPLSAVAVAESASDNPVHATFDRPTFLSLPGADEAPVAKSTQEVPGYQFIAGSAFAPRDTSIDVSYVGGGCVYGSGFLSTDVQLPDGVQLQGVRMYYFDDDPSTTVGVFITAYDSMGGLDDLRYGGSSFDTGYTNEYFNLDTPHTVDNFTNALVLNVQTGAGTQFCGARLYYTQ